MSGQRIYEIVSGLVCVAIGGLMCLYVYVPFFSKDPDDYYQRTVTLAETPKIIKVSRSPNEVIFNFKEYPDVSFGVQVNYFSGAINDFNVGDTANIMVLKKEYLCTVEHQGNALERLVLKRPNLFGFTRNGKDYIDFLKIGEEEISPLIVYPTVFLLAFMFLYGGIKIMFFKKRRMPIT